MHDLVECGHIVEQALRLLRLLVALEMSNNDNETWDNEGAWQVTIS